MRKLRFILMGALFLLGLASSQAVVSTSVVSSRNVSIQPVRQCPLNYPNPIALCGTGGKVIVVKKDANGCAIKYGCEKPKVCPQVYAPVCALPPAPSTNNKPSQPGPKTYDNECYAKAAGASIIHKGVCKGDEPIKPPVKICPQVYSPVCGLPPMPTCPKGTVCPLMMPGPKTYTNMCYLKKAGAKFLYKGKCKAKPPICPVVDAPSPWCKVVSKYKDNRGCIIPKYKCLSWSLRKKIDVLLGKFFTKIEKKYSSNTKRIEILKKIKYKLNELAKKKPKYELIVRYINYIIDKKIKQYSDYLQDIEHIFDQY